MLAAPGMTAAVTSRNISNTKDRFQTPKRKLKIRRAAEYFNELRGVLKCGQTLSGVFDLSSESKLKLRTRRCNKIVKIYAN